MHPELGVTVVHVLNSLACGGMEHTLVRMLREWSDPAFRHVVVTLREAGPLTASLPDHVACRALDIRNRSPFAWIRLAGVLGRLQPDLVHVRGARCWKDTALACLRVPAANVILGFHGWDASRAVTRGARMLGALARRQGARILTVSQASRRRLSAELGAPPDAIDVIPNGVDIRRFQPASPERRSALRRELGLAPDQPAIGIVGSLTPTKRHDLLLDAFTPIAVADPRPCLLIVGEGPQREWLEHRVATLGLTNRVRCLGWREDVERILPALDVYACTSDSEGCSNALLEALACGLPAVSTDVGDHAAVLTEHDAGFVTPPGQPKALVSALRRLLVEDRLRAAMGIQARRTVLKYDSATMAARYLDYYKTLVPHPCSRRSGCSWIRPATDVLPLHDLAPTLNRVTGSSEKQACIRT